MPFAEALARNDRGSEQRRPTNPPSVRHPSMRFSGGAISLETAAAAVTTSASGSDNGSAATPSAPDASSAPASARDGRRRSSSARV